MSAQNSAVKPRVGVIGGDGIGPAVVAEALKVIAACGVELDLTYFDLGADAYLRTGEVISDSTMSELRSLDAVLLGAIGPAVGSTDVPPGLLERGLLLKLRFDLDLYINMRPFNAVPDAMTPDMDLIVVRENTEGSYAGEGGVLRPGTAHEIATQGSVNTWRGVERCIRFAFELAAERPRRRLTMVHKTNVLTFAGNLWKRAFDHVAKDFPGVETDYNHVDATCIYMVERPSSYDVIVTDNLFGDILTDLAGALSGGIGLASSANLNPAKTGPSMFEPVHGAAHDIVGTGKANPLAAIRSSAMMLAHLGYADQAERITKAVVSYANELGSPSKGSGSSDLPTTDQIGDTVAGSL